MTIKSLDLRSFKIPLGKLAPRETFKTRLGDVLSYRFYPAWSPDLVVLYHGVGGDSRYMCVLASAIAVSGAASVVTPDFRCHGASLNSSDLIVENQLEVDLEELIVHLKMNRAISRVSLGGHSLGGGFALRIAVSEIRQRFASFFALAPYMPPRLETFRSDFGGWVEPLPEGFRVKMPEVFRSGQEKLEYSGSYLKAVTSPDDIIERLKSIKPSVQVITGAQDEVVLPEKQKEIFSEAGIGVHIISDLTHISIVSQPQTYLNYLF